MVFRGTPHYPQRAKSSIFTILTSTLQSHTAKPSGTAAQFHSTFRSGNPDNPTSIASHITVSSYTAALSQCHFRSIIQSIPHTLQHQEISTFRSVTHALVVSQQTHAVMFRLLLLHTESCCSGAHHIILKGQNPVSSLSSHPTAKPHSKTLRHCSAIPQHIPQW